MAAKRIQIFHATAPTCWWSWGYEATLNRLKLVYGDAVEIKLATLAVYENLAEWRERSGLDDESHRAWAKESAETMGVPISTGFGTADLPEDAKPAALAVVAAKRQGEAKAARLARELLLRSVVVGENVAAAGVLEDAARASGLDVQRLLRDLADKARAEEAYAAQTEGFPHLPLGFYNLVVTDGEGRTVLLDHAFDPRVVEAAIDWLADGRLAKRAPNDVVAYLREHGWAPLAEIGRVFGLGSEEARGRLAALEREGKIVSKAFAGGDHWRAAV